MPLFRGSSSIVRIISGSCGPVGPQGLCGDTGDSIAGVKGPLGFSGAGVISAGSSGNEGILFGLNDGRSIFVKGFTGSSVGDVNGITFSITNTGSRGFFKSASTGDAGEDPNKGLRAEFRSIKVSGKGIKLVDDSGDLIVVEGHSGFTSSMGMTGQLIYLNSGNTAQLGTDGLTYDVIKNVLSLKNKFIREHVPGLCSDIEDAFDNDMSYQTNFKIISDTLPGLGATGHNRSAFPNAGATGYSYPVTESTQSFGVTQLTPNIDLGSAATRVSNKIGFDPSVYSKDYGGITFREPIGSCCFCSNVDLPTGEQNTKCIDYIPKSYCDFMTGDFDGISSCAVRKEGPSCNDTIPCCVGNKCVETSLEKCDQFGGFPATGFDDCESLRTAGGCPNTCPGDVGACCLYGVCYSINGEQCKLLGGIFHEERSCNSEAENYYNCCLDLFPGACCVGRVCYDGVTPLECASKNIVDDNYDQETESQNPHYFQGPSSRCAGRSILKNEIEYQGVFYPDPDTGIIDEGTPSTTIRYCCSDPEALDPALNCAVTNLSPDGLAIGSEYNGGVFLGVVGEPAYGYDERSYIGSLNTLSSSYNAQSAAGSLNCDHLPLVIEEPVSGGDTRINQRRGHISELGYLTRDYSSSPGYEQYFAESDGLKFNELADIFYGQGYSIHRRWGLVADKTDLSIVHPAVGDNLPVTQDFFTWGLENRLGRVGGQYMLDDLHYNWASSVTDGYLNTSWYQRLDNESRFNLWFNENSTGADLNSVDRWLDEVNGSQWDAIGRNINEAAVEGFQDSFIASFNQMWDSINLATDNYSAMGGVYSKNGNSLDLTKGVDGWYLPSLVEMAHIRAFNTSMGIAEGSIQLSGIYWTSTTGNSQTVTPPSSYLNGDTRYNDEPWVTDSELQYRAASGYYAFTQDIGSNAGFARRTNLRKVRLVKRIPIYVVSKICYNSETYPASFPISCVSSGPCSCTNQETVTL